MVSQSHDWTWRAGKIGEEIDGSWSVSIFFDEAAVVLSTRSRVHRGPAVLTVVAEAVDVATEVGGILPATVQAMTLITDLVIKDIWFHLHLCERNEEKEKGKV